MEVEVPIMKLVKHRTIFLGLLALLALIYGLNVILEVPAREVAILFFVACFFVTSLAFLGLLFSFFRAIIKRWLRRRD